MELRPDSRIRVPAHVLHRDLGTETVLLDLDNGIYYGLDAVGTRFWSVLAEHPRLGDLHRELSGEFDVSAEKLWGDLADFITQLNQKGLIDVGHAEAGKG